MNRCEESKAPLMLNMLFFAVGGVHFAVDADQVEGTFSASDLDLSDFPLFHSEMGYGDRRVTYSEPTILAVKNENSGGYGVVIDGMEDIASVEASEIKALPPIVEPKALCRGLWGAVIRNGRIVLLLDFILFFNETDKFIPNTGG